MIMAKPYDEGGVPFSQWDGTNHQTENIPQPEPKPEENPNANANNHALLSVLYSYTESPAAGARLTKWFHEMKGKLSDDLFTELLARCLYDGLLGLGWPWWTDADRRDLEGRQ
jgi:hypothetical protein